MPINTLRDQMPALHDRLYLNTGTSGPVPAGSLQTQIDSLQRFTNEGFSTPDVTAAYVNAIASARRTIADLLNCPVTDVVLTNSTSDGIGIVAQGIAWQPGDEIITSDLEHISGIAPWLDVAARHGAKVVTLQSDQGHLTAEQFAQAITPHTRLICVSHVSWATGTVLPVQEICALARDAGVLTLIDGAQSVGHLPVDVTALGCDFYTVSGQKWLLGPEGTGALYINKSALDDVAPTRIGWPSLASPDATDGVLHFHPDARRFETGTVNTPAYAALTYSIGLLRAIGMENVFAHAVHLSNVAREMLTELAGVQILSPADTTSGLLSFIVPDTDPDDLVRHLWEHHRIIVRSIPTNRALRASFHVFNTEYEVVRLVQAIAAAMPGNV